MMKEKEKFVPYAKLSKRAKRAIDAKKRGSWRGLDPSTRIADNGKKYSRKEKHRERLF